MKKILLTGSNGFLGNYIFNEISKAHYVKTLGRNSNCDYIFDLTENHIELTEKYDIIIHNAGKAHTFPNNDFEIEQFYKVNVLGTNNLLSSIENIGIPERFVFISSVSVYGLQKGNMITENFNLNPKEPYGRSKLEAEIRIQNWCLINNVKCTILRLPLVIGRNAPGNFASMVSSIKKGIYFNIEKGQARRSMVLASDVAEYLLKSSEIGGIYNLTDGYNPSLHELSSAIANEIGKFNLPNMPFCFAKIIARFGDIVGNWFPLNSTKLSRLTSTLTFDDKKACISFGWNPKCVLNNIIF